MCGDIRLLANLKEIEEPFGKDQVRKEVLRAPYPPGVGLLDPLRPQSHQVPGV